jgi:phosphatidylglycerol:prolipoprotein diacylglycerol transferase
MSFHGGLTGLAIAMLAWALRKQRDVWALFGSVSLIAPAGLFSGASPISSRRIMGTPTDGSWGVVFPAAGSMPRHPSQLYEMLGEGLLLYLVLNLLVLRGVSMRKRGRFF